MPAAVRAAFIFGGQIPWKYLAARRPSCAYLTLSWCNSRFETYLVVLVLGALLYERQATDIVARPEVMKVTTPIVSKPMN